MKHENDYSLLRPFDLEKAKAGEPICCCLDEHRYEFLGVGTDIRQTAVATRIISANPELYISPPSALRMAPLCWVEGKPVYKGEVLFSKDGDEVKVISFDGTEIVSSPGQRCGCTEWSPEYMRWTPPKPAAPCEYDRLAKIVQEGREARSSGSPNPYKTNTVEGLAHSSGWVQRDLRIALDAEREKNRARTEIDALPCFVDGIRIDVPRHIVDAAITLGDFFENHNVKDWKFGKCQARVDTLGKTQGFINIYPTPRNYRGSSPARLDGPYVSRYDADHFAGSDRVDCVEVWFSPPARPQ